MSLIQIIDLPDLGDNRGGLIAIESGKQVPFDIKRVYYIYGSDRNKPRGFHAHKKLKQLLVCVAGSCDLVLDDGKSRRSVRLDSPKIGVILGDLVWREMHDFSGNAVLLVLASEYYDESDYVRDYHRFLELVNG